MYKVKSYNFNAGNNSYDVCAVRIKNAAGIQISLDIHMTTGRKSFDLTVRAGDEVFFDYGMTKAKLVNITDKHVTVKPANGKQVKVEIEAFACRNLP
jgi:hypothetical protein